MPATNLPATLSRCADAILAANDPPEELIMSRRQSDGNGPEARNRGAQRATGDILVFVDSDVEVGADTFARIRAAFASDPGLTAVFGSYDDTPDGGTVSVFRNLLHHHVHHDNAGPATTFWTGLGAIRRDAFFDAGAFDAARFTEPSVEDIEFGMRLAASGGRIELLPEIQGKHLKRWSLLEMVRTDIFDRGRPWVKLLLHQRTGSTALNLAWRHRLSAIAALTVMASLIALTFTFAAALPLALALGTLLGLNLPFYRLLARRQGLWRALVGIGLHIVHLLTAVASVPIGAASHLADTSRPRRPRHKPRSEVTSEILRAPINDRRLVADGTVPRTTTSQTSITMVDS